MLFREPQGLLISANADADGGFEQRFHESSRQMVELVRAGRSPEELAREFEPTAQSIKNWSAERDAGRGDGGLTTSEREELNRLRRENRASSGLSGKSCQQPRPGSLGRRTRFHRRIPVREREPGQLSDRQHVPAAGCLLQQLLCVGEARLAEIRAGHATSHGTYGAWRIHDELAAKAFVSDASASPG
jgi:transposase